MNGTDSTKQAIDLITAILSTLPESAAETRKLRTRIVEAGNLYDVSEHGFAAILAETIHVLRANPTAADPIRNSTLEDHDDLFAAADAGAAVDMASATPTETMNPAPEETAAAAETTAAAQTDSATAAPAETTAAAQAPRWTDREKMLYRDVIHLFELGDHIGAMASLERAFMLAPGAAELNAFLGKNENTLLKLYRDHIGSMDRVTIPSRSRKTIRIPTPDPELMLKIIRMSDGHRPIREFVKKLDVPELHVLMVISHLTRSGYLELA